VDNLLRLRFGRYRQTPCTLKRVKAHVRTDVSVKTFTLGAYSILPNFDKQEYKANASISICL